MDAQKLAYDTCRDYLHDLSDTHRLKASLLGSLRARDLKALCGCSKLFDPNIDGIEILRSTLQVEAFFKKNEAFSDRERCLEAAVESFRKSELLCKLTNKRLDHFYAYQDRLDPDVRLVISRARRWIDETLGDVREFEQAIPDLIRLTAGATADTKRSRSRPYLKVRKKIACTSATFDYVKALYAYYGLPEPVHQRTLQNRVTFVPKNWKTYRTIACEPMGQLPFQLAFDSYCKSKLRRRGFDLSSQLVNQSLAKQGSIDGSFATIDLTAASDTVSINAVAWLLPADWFRVLKSFRSPLYTDPKTKTLNEYHKFSSMGNGSTFCIETLIFAALLRGSGCKRGVVYGDDIVVASEHSALLLKTLKLFGFVTNHDKTFLEGPYRESCGTHWFRGVSVTPFFVRGNVQQAPFLSHVVNGLAAVSLPYGALWARLRSLVKEQVLLMVPFSDVTTSGIFLDHRVARDLGLIKIRGWIPFCRVYVFKIRRISVTGIRGLLLTYLDSRSQGSRKFPLPDLRRSRYDEASGKYARKSRCIHPDVAEAPDHILIWSEYLVRVS